MQLNGSIINSFFNWFILILFKKLFYLSGSLSQDLSKINRIFSKFSLFWNSFDKPSFKTKIPQLALLISLNLVNEVILLAIVFKFSFNLSNLKFFISMYSSFSIFKLFILWKSLPIPLKLVIV